MTTRGTILVVEDGPSERDAMARMLRMENFEVLTAANPDQALRYLPEPVDLVLSDLRMGRKSGIDLLKIWRQRRPKCPFVMVTAYGEVDSAVESMKLGANDYLTKPVDPTELLNAIDRSIASTRQDWAASAEDWENMVGQSPLMMAVFEQAQRVAPTDSNVLILGEPGTGKELLATAIHRHGSRGDQPLVVVNMAAIPALLVESELFGHVKGSFPAAMDSRVGRLESADQGTVFIDEVGALSLACQAKLLRLLEQQTLTPVGSNEDRQADVRIIAASSRNLSQMVAEGTFRQELFSRLNVVVITIPPLRQRRSDIPLLAQHFLNKLATPDYATDFRMTPDLVSQLEDLPWPGNVRQLRDCLESMVALANDSLLLSDDLPQSILEPPTTASLPLGGKHANRNLENIKRQAMLAALREFGGNRTRAAEALGISVRTLQRRLKEWDLSDEVISGQ